MANTWSAVGGRCGVGGTVLTEVFEYLSWETGDAGVCHFVPILIGSRAGAFVTVLGWISRTCQANVFDLNTCGVAVFASIGNWIPIHFISSGAFVFADAEW